MTVSKPTLLAQDLDRSGAHAAWAPLNLIARTDRRPAPLNGTFSGAALITAWVSTR
jgi:hypothetical protein